MPSRSIRSGSYTARGTVLVTGASSGIGRMCALTLASQGFRVFAGVRTERDAETLRAGAPANISTLMLDITDAHQVAAAGSLLQGELGDGALGGLINNAGICVTGPLEHVPIRGRAGNPPWKRSGASSRRRTFLCECPGVTLSDCINDETYIEVSLNFLARNDIAK